jgi:hypothetical protein
LLAGLLHFDAWMPIFLVMSSRAISEPRIETSSSLAALPRSLVWQSSWARISCNRATTGALS